MNKPAVSGESFWVVVAILLVINWQNSYYDNYKMQYVPICIVIMRANLCIGTTLMKFIFMLITKSSSSTVLGKFRLHIMSFSPPVFW